MKRLICAFLALALIFSPVYGFASPGFFRDEMVEFQPRPSAPQNDYRLPSHYKDKSGAWLDSSFDQFGRLWVIRTSNGNEYVFVYGSMLEKSPTKVILNGKERSLPLFKPSTTKYITSEDPDFPMFVGYWGDYIGAYGGCIACTDITDSFTDLFNYIFSTAGLGAVLGGTAGIIGGTVGLEFLALVGLGAGAGFAFAVWTAFWYNVGTFVYDISTKITYRVG